MKRVCALLFALVIGVACDKAPDAPKVDAGPPPEPETVTQGADAPLEASGKVESKDGPTLQWSQTFSAGKFRALTQCVNRLYGLSDGGRIVEWDPKTLAPKQVLTDFGAVTAIDANKRELLAGTADGRLLRATCEGRNPLMASDVLSPVRWVHLDARSNTRAFIVYQESPSEKNKLAADEAVVTLFNLEEDEMREPFRRPWPANGSVFGFTDYKGELWLGLNPGNGKSNVWYLERFDEAQPGLGGLGDDRLRGFVQMSREVWSYGGTSDGKKSLIYRVDTNKAKPMWDGEKGWFGEQPGGELPSDPIVAMNRGDKELVIISRSAVYRADRELRRWRILHANDPVADVFANATQAVEVGDRVLIGTEHGLVEVSGETWRRVTVPDAPTPAPAGAAPVADLTWRGEVFTATTRGLTSRPPDKDKAKPFKLGPRKKVHGLFVDSADRLWAFAEDGTWLITGATKGQQHHWDTAPMGASPRAISGVANGASADDLVLTTNYGAQFNVKIAGLPEVQ